MNHPKTQSHNSNLLFSQWTQRGSSCSGSRGDSHTTAGAKVIWEQEWAELDVQDGNWHGCPVMLAARCEPRWGCQLECQHMATHVTWVSHGTVPVSRRECSKKGVYCGARIPREPSKGCKVYDLVSKVPSYHLHQILWVNNSESQPQTGSRGTDYKKHGFQEILGWSLETHIWLICDSQSYL